jgi:hypothetical protein
VKLRKNKADAIFTASEDYQGAGSIAFVGGPRPYLTVHTDPNKSSHVHHASFSGPKSLRKLARAILRATAPRKRKHGSR